MEHNFPCPIISDKDLKYYEDYLKKAISETKRYRLKTIEKNEK